MVFLESHLSPTRQSYVIELKWNKPLLRLNVYQENWPWLVPASPFSPINYLARGHFASQNPRRSPYLGNAGHWQWSPLLSNQGAWRTDCITRNLSRRANQPYPSVTHRQRQNTVQGEQGWICILCVLVSVYAMWIFRYAYVAGRMKTQAVCKRTGYQAVSKRPKN